MLRSLSKKNKFLIPNNPNTKRRSFWWRQEILNEPDGDGPGLRWNVAATAWNHYVSVLTIGVPSLGQSLEVM